MKKFKFPLFFSMAILLVMSKFIFARDSENYGENDKKRLKKLVQQVEKITNPKNAGELQPTSPKLPCQACTNSSESIKTSNKDASFGLPQLKQLITQGLSFVPDQLSSNGSDYQSIANNSGHPCNLFYNIKTKKLGSYGISWLQTMVDLEAFESTPSNLISNHNKGITPFCGGFNHFSPLQKAEFWVFFGMQLAFKESSCDHKKSAGGMYGQVAAGLYAWERDQSHIRRARGVEGVTARNCAGDPFNAENSIRCAVGYFYRVLDQGDALNSTDSYFQELRASPSTTARRKMKSILSQFPGC